MFRSVKRGHGVSTFSTQLCLAPPDYNAVLLYCIQDPFPALSLSSLTFLVLYQRHYLRRRGHLWIEAQRGSLCVSLSLVAKIGLKVCLRWTVMGIVRSHTCKWHGDERSSKSDDDFFPRFHSCAVIPLIQVVVDRETPPPSSPPRHPLQRLAQVLSWVCI